MRTKILSTKRVVYPFDYDKNGKTGLKEWRQYIHSELGKSISASEMLVVDAKKVLTRDARYKDPVPCSPNLNVDRWVYVFLFSFAITIALIVSI